MDWIFNDPIYIHFRSNNWIRFFIQILFFKKTSLNVFKIQIQIFGSIFKSNSNIQIKFKIHNPFFIKEIKLNFLKLVFLGPTRYNLARAVNLAHMVKKSPIKEAHKAKNHTKAIWVKARPWAFFLNMKTILFFKKILLNFSSPVQGRQDQDLYRSSDRPSLSDSLCQPDIVGSSSHLTGQGCRSCPVCTSRQPCSFELLGRFSLSGSSDQLNLFGLSS